MDSDLFIEVLGVPQGSNLGPSNELESTPSMRDRDYTIYTDDIKNFRHVVNMEDSIARQNNIDVISEWCELNRMSLNNSKYLINYNNFY